MKRFRQRNDIRVRADNSLDLHVRIRIPVWVKEISEEVGVILGNGGVGAIAGHKMDFLVTENGTLKLELKDGGVPLYTPLTGQTGMKSDTCVFVGWYVGWLVCWLAGLLVCWLVDLLVDLLVCWLVDLLVGWLVDWLIG